MKYKAGGHYEGEFAHGLRAGLVCTGHCGQLEPDAHSGVGVTNPASLDLKLGKGGGATGQVIPSSLLPDHVQYRSACWAIHPGSPACCVL